MSDPLIDPSENSVDQEKRLYYNETTFLGQDELPPDGFLQPKRYKISYHCIRCGGDFSKIVTRLDKKDPPCPRKVCKEIIAQEVAERGEARLLQMLEERQAPAQVGHRTGVKAIDLTAEIVMKDHGLTNLNDNIREGEAMAPKLPPVQQQKADGFFGAQAMGQRYGADRRMQQTINLLGRRALAGAFKSGAVNPARVLPGQPGEPVLRKVREENYGGKR